MEAIRSSETSGTTLRTTRRHIPEDDTLQNHRCENLKSYIIFPVYKNGNKTDCSNDRGISLLSSSYKMLPNVFLSKLSPYVEDIIGGSSDQIGVRRSRSTIDQIVSILQTLEKNWEYIETVH
jgi:hypothetical protein